MAKIRNTNKINRMVRLTNIYITSTNTATEDAISLEEWPCKEFDLILGNINAHSLLLEDNCKNGKENKRRKCGSGQHYKIYAARGTL